MATIFPVRHRAAISGVFLISLTLLAWNAGSPGLATTYVDPVAKIQAQDESLYGSISLGMAKNGDWLTPRFLDRYALFKPPLLYWLEAAGVKVLGPRRIALRLPSILAGAATVTLVFAWLLAENASLAAAAAGAMLLLSSHLFFVLSRIGLTDALLTFETALAMFALARDPRLVSRAGLWTFGLASGAAMLTKGIAGLFSLLALAVLCAMSLVFGRERPAWRRLAAAIAISAAVAAPWHLYQLVRNTRWFWAEYVLTEVVTNSVGSPLQSTQESQVGFYLKRMIALDAPLFAAALIALTISWRKREVLTAPSGRGSASSDEHLAIPLKGRPVGNAPKRQVTDLPHWLQDRCRQWWGRSVTCHFRVSTLAGPGVVSSGKHEQFPTVLLVWIGVVLAAALSFAYRNTSYLLPLFPALALLVGGAIPNDRAKLALGLAVALFAAKALAPEQTWGIPFKPESAIPVEPALNRYAAMKRGNGLILGDPNDGFSSACLGLPRVRYLFLDASFQRRRYALDFEYLGVVMTAPDFANLAETGPQFEQRLRDWGLRGGDPIATVILAPTLGQIQALVHDHPGSDFLLPVEWAAHDAGVHQILPVGDGRELLLSREVVQRP